MSNSQKYPLNKAYDLKVLSQRLKDRGLDLAEDALVIVTEELSDWTVDSAVLSKTPWDDIAATVMPQMKGFVMQQVDQVDGKSDLES